MHCLVRVNLFFQGMGSSIGDVIGDALVSARQATANLADNLAREARRNEVLRGIGDTAGEVGELVKEGALDLSERVGNEWQKVTEKVSGEDDSGRREREQGSRRMLGNMPPGCFCDMRGYSCPMHRGRELWRFSKDYQLHVEHNVDPNNPGERATGIAGEAAPGTNPNADPRPPPSRSAGGRVGGGSGGGSGSGASREYAYGRGRSREELEKLDEAFATLLAMGFDPKRVSKVLELHGSVERATHALLDDPTALSSNQQTSPPPPRVSSDSYVPSPPRGLGAPPSQPPPPPPLSAGTQPQQALAGRSPQVPADVSSFSAPDPMPDLLGDLLESDGPDLLSAGAPPTSVFGTGNSSSSATAMPADPTASIAALAVVDLLDPLAGRLPGAPVPASQQATTAAPTAAMATNSCGSGFAGFNVATGGSGVLGSPNASRPAPPTASMGASTPAASTLPPGWHQCSDPRTGRAYWYDTNTQTSHWQPPTTVSNVNVQGNPRGPLTSGRVAHGAGITVASPSGASSNAGRGENVSVGISMDSTMMGTGTGGIAALPSQGVMGSAPVAAAASPPMPQAGAVAALPPGWHACVDSTHNRTYYFNTVSKQSQWTVPTAPATGTGTGAGPGALPSMPFRTATAGGDSPGVGPGTRCAILVYCDTSAQIIQPGTLLLTLTHVVLPRDLTSSECALTPFCS
jgi:hypothetical protein